MLQAGQGADKHHLVSTHDLRNRPWDRRHDNMYSTLGWRLVDVFFSWRGGDT